MMILSLRSKRTLVLEKSQEKEQEKKASKTEKDLIAPMDVIEKEPTSQTSLNE